LEAQNVGGKIKR